MEELSLTFFYLFHRTPRCPVIINLMSQGQNTIQVQHSESQTQIFIIIMFGYTNGRSPLPVWVILNGRSPLPNMHTY